MRGWRDVRASALIETRERAPKRLSPYRRNILVGVTVIGALVMLGWMILKFGDRPARLFGPDQMLVHFQADRADGLGEGSAVQFKGVDVGRISIVRRTPDGLG